MNAILDIVQSDIITNLKCIDNGFSKMKHKNIFIYGFSYDCNDALLVEIVRQHNAVLITNDAHYANMAAIFK